MTPLFSCPQCASPGLEPSTPCPSCGWQARIVEGVPDFVGEFDNEAERAFFDDRYRRDAERIWSSEDVAALWEDRRLPYLATLRALVGPLAGRRVLTIGNGSSLKEFAFLADDPEAVIYSDLSANGMARLGRLAPWAAADPRAHFAAIDAFRLPVPDRSIDLLYGFAVVHHLPDVERFLAEAARVVAPGGRALFFDDGYAPVWQKAKTTLLRPVMRWSQEKHGMSPEDVRFSLSGGFREEQLSRWITAHGLEPSFVRRDVLYFLFQRGSEKLLPPRLHDAVFRPAVTGLLARLDEQLVRLPAGRRNAVRLMWGFQVP